LLSASCHAKSWTSTIAKLAAVTPALLRVKSGQLPETAWATAGCKKSRQLSASLKTLPNVGSGHEWQRLSDIS